VRVRWGLLRPWTEQPSGSGTGPAASTGARTPGRTWYQLSMRA